MKRNGNKLLRKILSLGLAAAVAVSSMAPTLAMMEPVVVKAEEVVAQTDVRITEVEKATINNDMPEKDSAWAQNAKKVEQVTISDNIITVKANLEEMTDAANGVDDTTKGFPIVVTLSKTVSVPYTIDGSPSSDLSAGNRITDVWKCLGKADASEWEGDSDKGKKCIVWLSEEWKGNGHQISFDGGTNSYTIIVVDSSKVMITVAEKATINSNMEESGSTWAKNAGEVKEFAISGNIITVKADLGKMTSTINGAGELTKGFPIVVTLSEEVEDPYTIDGSPSSDPNAENRITDVWKCLGKADASEWASDPDKGKKCIVWLSEEWGGGGHQISFGGDNIYTIKVVDTPSTGGTPTTPGGNQGGNGGGSGSSGGSSGGGSGSSGGSGSGSGSGGAGTTPVVPAVTTTADGTTVSLNKDGAYVDKDGKPAANTVIKEPTGVMHITDATGHVVKNSIATTADGKNYVVDADGKVVVSNIAQINGNKYIAGASGQLLKGQFSNISGNTYYSDANGVVKTNGLFTAENKQYVADENGVIVKDKMTTLADGKKVYSGEDGVVVTNKMVTVDGKKYFAAKNGVIATKKIVRAGGKKYYATKTGEIATKKIVKAGGKKYYATKSGALATNKWVKVGNKKYYCNKKGVITKTKKVKK